jgi:anaerobic selenocysteine-containing dehydrogenase
MITTSLETAVQTRYRACNLCEAMCGLKFTIDGTTITRIEGDEADPLSRGYVCPKGPAMREIWEDPDRLQHPVVRDGNAWKHIAWDRAYTEIAEKLCAIRDKYGPDSIAFYAGNPVLHNHGALPLFHAFAAGVGTRNVYDQNSVDANPRMFASYALYGSLLRIPVPDVDRTDYLLILGANPAASNGSGMGLGDVRGRLRAVRERGGKMVLFDPRRTETARVCDEHHFVRPGSDAALLLSLMHTVFELGAVDSRALASIAVGCDELRAAVAPFSPERVAPTIGVPAETIRRIAREFSSAKRAVAYSRVGVSQTEFGATITCLADMLTVVTGNFDRPGGLMFSRPAIDVESLGDQFDFNGYARFHSRVRGAPELGGKLPVAVLAEEMEREGPGQIRALICVAGNPLRAIPNSSRLERAMQKLDLVVGLDMYINDSLQHAHYVLPVRHPFERDHYELLFSTFQVRNAVRYSSAIVPPRGDTREDWDILYEIGMRVCTLRWYGPAPINAAIKAAWRLGVRLNPTFIIDYLFRVGPYGDKYLPFLRGLNLRRVKGAEHGMDLGPMVPWLPEKQRKRLLRRAWPKVSLNHPLVLGDLPRVEASLDAATNADLVLIGRRHLRSNNSWMHNVRSLTKGPDRTRLLMNEADARTRGLSSGQRVLVESRVGRVETTVEISDDMMPGVVSLPHGWGHQRAADTMRVAASMAGVNINDLTDDERLDPISGNAAVNGVPVRVCAT